MDDIQRLLGFRERLAQDETSEQISSLFLDDLKHHGFTSFVCGTIPIMDHAKRDYVSFGSPPSNWSHFYGENDLRKADYALWRCVS